MATRRKAVTLRAVDPASRRERDVAAKLHFRTSCHCAQMRLVVPGKAAVLKGPFDERSFSLGQSSKKGVLIGFSIRYMDRLDLPGELLFGSVDSSEPPS